jgi:hypothetical protein
MPLPIPSGARALPAWRPYPGAATYRHAGRQQAHRFGDDDGLLRRERVRLDAAGRRDPDGEETFQRMLAIAEAPAEDLEAVEAEVAGWIAERACVRVPRPDPAVDRPVRRSDHGPAGRERGWR